MDAVADADVILFRCATVGHDMKVEPRCHPFMAVLKVVVKDLSLCRERDKHGRTKQYDSGANPHWHYIFGKNSVFVQNASSLSAKKSAPIIILIRCAP
jgi:hypothetical protein